MKKSELRQIIKEEIKEFLVRRNLGNLKEETEFEAYYNGKKIQIKAKDLWDAKKQAIQQFKVPKSKQGLVAVQSLKSKANQDFRFEATEKNPLIGRTITVNAGRYKNAKGKIVKAPSAGTNSVTALMDDGKKIIVHRVDFELDEDYNWNNEPNNKIYWKPKTLKKVGWIVISKSKNDGRPLYALYDTDDSKWGATYRMGSAKYSESSPLFYTVPIKIEGNKFRILSENEKWSRPYAYQKIEIKGKDYN
ncbi:MAG: hypothetical protein JETCAE03_33320 [Ignavibacteriaceae bacterium]|jgi:hypothetical protein|nr:MAG: hypothetical protein JETCAE03_33320 [Ignavibacteriaceae bacterium]